MRSGTISVKEKGDIGEQLCIKALLPYCDMVGGKLVHSFEYPCATRENGEFYPGNIFFEGDTPKAGPAGGVDEIDVVLLTPRRIFAIEVKSYSNARFVVTDDATYKGSAKLDKDLIAQTEKHCRHFYHNFYEVLPDGKPDYIIPVFCSVDKSSIKNESHDPIIFCVLNNVARAISQVDKYSSWSIDIPAVLSAMKKKSSRMTVI